jgi:toxin FitB
MKGLNLVDSCGWLEYFADGPNASFFAPPLEDEESLIVPTICLLEVFGKVLMERGEPAALQSASAMSRGRLVALDAGLALAAAKLGADLRLPLTDSVILATAQAAKATVWTQDADFRNIDGVRYRKRPR